MSVYCCSFSFILAFCTNGSTRLNGGTLRGRVEVCINRTWWSICPNSWSYSEASVVCRQLGFSEYGKLDEKSQNMV